MKQPIHFIIGICLIPTCAALSLTLIQLLHMLALAPVSLHSGGIWWLPGGFTLWLILYLAMPRPTLAYIFGHELTHLLWAWLLGMKAGHLRIRGNSGCVQVEGSHFLVTLAPYFFPLYTMLVLLLRFVIQLFYDTTAYEPFWLGLIGLTWSFHVTFTLSMLKSRQSDILREGRIFSYAIIYLMNVLGICLWLVFTSVLHLEQLSSMLFHNHLLIFTAEKHLFDWLKLHIHELKLHLAGFT